MIGTRAARRGDRTAGHQSGRTGLYAEALAQLEKKGLLYPCFCTRAQLLAAEAPHNSDGETIYSGRCRGLAAEQIEAQARLRAPAVRLRLPDEAVRFVDGHYGPVEQNLARECGDIILRRSDGVFATSWPWCWTTRHGVTQVVRGRDPLSSTPRQMYLYRLLVRVPRVHPCPAVAGAGWGGFQVEARPGLCALRWVFRRGDRGLGHLRASPHPRPARPRDLLPFSWEKVPKEN
ncbi:MAG: glutamate--tRNA ligase family protein [Anaeromassilibacillus sp.]